MKLSYFSRISFLVTVLSFVNLFWFIDATILAIDYGTGFSKNSIIGATNPLDIVLSQDSKRKDVSGIMLRPDGKKDDIERIYGSNLLNFQLRFPQYVVLGLKSLIGKSKVNEIFTSLNPGLDIATVNDRLVVDIGTKHKFSVEELIAMDFNHIISNAKQQFPAKKMVLNGINNNIDDLVLSVPNFYKQNERLMLGDIVEISDFEQSLGFVDDNLATGISYIAKSHFKFEEDNNTHFVVYDMGQESSKASLFTAFKNSSAILNKDEVVDLTIELNGYGYDENLGGDFFTDDLKHLIINKFLDKNTKYKKNQLLNNSKFLAKISQVAEKCKLVLSANADYKIFVESLVDDINFKTVVTRNEFENIIMSNYKSRILKPLNDVFASSNSVFQNQNITLDNISAIILTGGSTRVPFVQQALVDYLGNDYKHLLSKSVNSDESVTTGLAIRGVSLENTFKFKQRINVINKLIYNYTLSVAGKEEQIILPAGELYPNKKTLTLSLDDLKKKSTFEFKLNENSDAFVEYSLQSSKLKKCEVEGAYVNVTFGIDKDRLFSVDKIESVCNGTSTKLRGLTTEKYLLKQPLSNTEIKNSKKFIKLLNEKDEQKVILTEALNLFESSLYEARSFVEEVENTEVPSDLIETLENSISECIEWLDYDSDGCTLGDIETKHLDISHQLLNIKNYQKSLSTSLNLDDFNHIFENITTWLDDLESMDEFYLQAVLNKTESFNELNMTETPLEVYNSVPLTKRLFSQNETFSKEIKELTESFIPKLKHLLENFEQESRLVKFETKLEFLNHLELINSMTLFHEELFKYRFKYLEASILKRQRYLLRQYEKSKLEKIRELGLKDKDGNLVEEVMEKAHKRAEAREKQSEEDFLKQTNDYASSGEKDDVEIEKDEVEIEKDNVEVENDDVEVEIDDDDIEIEFDEL